MNKKSGYMCPKCGKELRESKKAIECADSLCGFVLFKNHYEIEFSEKDIEDLFNKGLTGKVFKVIEPDGRKKEVRFRLNRTTWKVESDYLKKEEKNPGTLGSCPKCGNPVLEKDRGFFCKDRNCGFVIWRIYFEATLERKDVEALLKDGITLKKFRMRNKFGKIILGFLKLNKQTFEVVYEFH